ncbi:unnamed protein product [Rangifer tarandus platyrhynchus]|uniref:Uncharacterized protein n=1 Tax=Rangifer tarandus platyrhynchus TaxID=3082113 RepID=A0AC59YIS8_RANTA
MVVTRVKRPACPRHGGVAPLDTRCGSGWCLGPAPLLGGSRPAHCTAASARTPHAVTATSPADGEPCDGASSSRPGVPGTRAGPLNVHGVHGQACGLGGAADLSTPTWIAWSCILAVSGCRHECPSNITPCAELLSPRQRCEDVTLTPSVDALPPRDSGRLASAAPPHPPGPVSPSPARPSLRTCASEWRRTGQQRG